MADAKRDLVRAWLTKAHRDLEAACSVTSRDPPLFDIGAFHCQQAAEKAVKAFLVFSDSPFPKTHDVGDLAERAAQREVRFAAWVGRVAHLSDYAVGARYPDVTLEVTSAQYAEAAAAAAAFCEFVVSVIPADMHPAA